MYFTVVSMVSYDRCQRKTSGCAADICFAGVCQRTKTPRSRHQYIWKGNTGVWKEERLGSRLGFILLSAGCAIGCGNVWKFPWMVGTNGGGAFVLLYILCLIVLGMPAMTMEFAMGRAAQASPVRMSGRGSKKRDRSGICTAMWHCWGMYVSWHFIRL